MIKKRSPCFTFKGVLYPSHPFFNPMTPFYHYSKPPNPNISATSQLWPLPDSRFMSSFPCRFMSRPFRSITVPISHRSMVSQSQYLTIPCLTIPLFQPSHVTGPQPRPCQKTYPNTAVLSKKKAVIEKRLSKKGCQKTTQAACSAQYSVDGFQYCNVESI